MRPAITRSTRPQSGLPRFGRPRSISARLTSLRSRLHDEELGAQAAEYAMLGGVSAAACGALIALIKNKSTLTRLVEAVFDGLASFVGGWF